MRWGGAAYMLWLAWRIANSGPVRQGEAQGRPLGFFGAAAFQWINPKAWAIAISALTAYSVSDDYAVSVAAVAFGYLAMAFLLSRGFGLLRTRPERKRKVILGVAFGVMAIGSMMMAFPVGPGIIGDLRNVVIAVAAVVGGPIPALITAAVAIAFRIHLGGQIGAGTVGIATAAGLSIAFAWTKLAKTPRNLALFGIVLAIANSLFPLVAFILAPKTLEQQALHTSTTFLVFGGIIYPIAIVVIGGLLRSEQRRAEDEAELKTVNAALSLEAERSQGIFERTGVAMVWNDLGSGHIVRANPQFAKFTGYSEVELAGKRFEELSVPEDRERDLGTLTPLLASDVASVSDERRYLRKDGAVVWGMRSLTTVRVGKSRYAFAIVQDITERKRAHEEIAYLASHDSLTGLANRLVFLSELANAITRLPPLMQVAVLYLDLDDFKEINDRFGHPVGDATFIEIARRLRDCTTKDDIAARIGGDEFVVLRKGAISLEEIHELAEMIISRSQGAVRARCRSRKDRSQYRDRARATRWPGPGRTNKEG